MRQVKVFPLNIRSGADLRCRLPFRFRRGCQEPAAARLKTVRQHLQPHESNL